jgi:CRISPR-associated endonuclease/helicase Cas3
MRLDPSRFDDWFRELNNLRADQGPFPWQRRLFREWLCTERAEEARWPQLIKLPTASGKTAIIDLAVLALAAGSPCARRRAAFVVDRRVVVDEAASRAQAIAVRLRRALDSTDDLLHDVAKSLMSLGGERPLVVSTLRGGIPSDDNWARSPAQPAIVLSTVDQVGSRLLFRAYGSHGPRSWPIHAGLLGRDTLVIIDEAHCAGPFCETAKAISDRWQDFAERPVGGRLSLVRMSATPGEQPDFELDNDDRNHEILRLRLSAAKRAELVVVKDSHSRDRSGLTTMIVERAQGLLNSMRSGVVGVVVNRVADARFVFEHLEIPPERKILLTGRVRNWERDRVLREWLPRIRAGSREESNAPLAVVATQCIEVGANLDFDYLITEVAALDALRQRFGRVDRLGDRAGRIDRLGDCAATPGVVVATSSQVQANDQGDAAYPDRVYGHALSRTWAWLNTQATGQPLCVNLGIDALEPLLPEGDALQSLCQGVTSAYSLLPVHLDALSQSSPPPQPNPELSAFLHGTTQSSPEVVVVWRCDLQESDSTAWPDRVAVQPPAPGEGCPTPIWEFHRWLAGERSTSDDTGDIEGADAGEEAVPSRKPVLRWRGMSDVQVLAATDVMPGDTVVVPSDYGGCDEFGWNPSSEQAVRDIGDAAAHAVGRRCVLRLEALRKTLSHMDGVESAQGLLGDLARWAAGDDEAPEASGTLTNLASIPGLPEWLCDTARSLAADHRRRPVDADGVYAIVGRRSSGEDLGTAEDSSSSCVQVPLANHCVRVRGYAKRFAQALGLPAPLISDIALAGVLHDVGKADPRFQVWLHGGNEEAAALADAPLAKSSQNPRNRAAVRRARERAGYPRDARHEAQSLALIKDQDAIRNRAHDWDLVQHLVVSHHGFGRPFIPVVVDPDPTLVALNHGPLCLSYTSEHLLYRFDSGIADRYWRLVRRYGWWGLAWLEAILRLADHRRSEDEERREVSRA